MSNRLLLLVMRWRAIALLLAYYAASTLFPSLPRLLLTQSTLQPIAKTNNLLSSTNILLSQVESNRLEVGASAPAVAKQVTVRIFGKPGTGSGAIVQRRGQTYTVVTCAHVVAESQDRRYTILTADGKSHVGRWLRWVQFPNADLALVQFTSNQAYQVAAIADSKALTVGDPVYASGFPSWYWNNSNAIEDTRNWGIKAFRLTSGKLAMLPEKSLQEGYQLGYTNEIEQGMSGGPVLDKYGRLIGINGRLKYPPQGIVAFIFADGSVPSEEIFQQMEGLSWAVPSAMFLQALNSKVSDEW